MGVVAEIDATPTTNINSKITSNVKADLQTTMAFFSMDEHTMASVEIRAQGEANILGRKCFGCDRHAAHEGDSNHLY